LDVRVLGCELHTKWTGMARATV